MDLCVLWQSGSCRGLTESYSDQDQHQLCYLTPPPTLTENNPIVQYHLPLGNFFIHSLQLVSNLCCELLFKEKRKK